MAVSTNSSVFLTSLSSFWNTLFADKNVLSVFYTGTEELVGQAYLDFLENVLSRSLKNTPLFHREMWELLLLERSKLKFDVTKIL